MFLTAAVAVVALAAVLWMASRRADPWRNARRFPVRGVVVLVRHADRMVALRHDDIPDFMPAMTMPFHVPRDQDWNRRLRPGDSLVATLEVTAEASRLRDVHVVGSGVLSDAEGLAEEDWAGAGTGASGRAPAPLPDVALTDSRGHMMRTSNLRRGRAVALSFLYTRCPLPDACPRLSATLAQAQQLLEARPALKPRVRILTATLDPAYDTPARLQRYALEHHADPGLWTFATGDSGALAALRAAARYYTQGRGLGLVHAQTITIYRPDGSFSRRIDGTSWTPQELVAALEEAAADAGAPTRRPGTR